MLSNQATQYSYSTGQVDERGTGPAPGPEHVNLYPVSSSTFSWLTRHLLQSTNARPAEVNRLDRLILISNILRLEIQRVNDM